MSETTNLKLKKHDEPLNENTEQFNVRDYLNGNWDKIEDFAGQVNDKVIEIEDSIDLVKQRTEQAVEDINTDIEDIKQEQTTQNTDIAKNKQDISNLDTNKASKSELQEATIALQAELKQAQEEIERQNKDYEAGTLEGQDTGESLYLADSSDARFRSFEIGGNSKQEKRSGINIWNDVSVENKAISSLSSTQVSVSNLKLTKAGNYCFRLFFTDNTYATSNVTVLLKDNANNTVAEVGVLAIKNLTQEQIEEITSGIVWTNAEGLNAYASKTIKGLMLVQTDTFPGEYEQYGAMPSLEFSSPIRAVGQDVNIFDKDSVEFYNNNMDSFSNTTNSNTTRVRTSSFEIEGGETYTLSGLTGKTTLLSIRPYGKDEKIVSTGISRVGNTFTLTKEVKYIHLLFKNNDDSELNREDVKAMPIKLQKGAEVTAYSPYNQGSCNVTVCDKNLFDKNAKTIKGTYSGDLSITDDKIFFKSTEFQWNTVNRVAWLVELPNLQKDIYISTESIIRPYTNNAGLYYKFVEDKNVTLPTGSIPGIINISTTANGKQLKITPTSKYLMILLQSQYVDASASTGLPEDRTVTINKLMVSYSENSSYKSHEEQTFTMPVQEPMLEEDKFERVGGVWKEKHNYVKVVVDGEAVKVRQTKSTGTTIQCCLLTSNLIKEDATGYCNMGKQHNYFNTVNTFVVSSTKNVYMHFPLNILGEQEITDANLNTLLKQKADAGEPLTFVLEAIEPMYLNCTEAQIKALDEIEKILHSYKGGTHVYCTDKISAIFNVKYTKDLNAVINNLSQQAIE